MAKKEKKVNDRVEVSIDTLKVGDRIYVDLLDIDEYEILDIGVPFMLILNTRTGFASLYKARTVYKK